MLRLPSLAVLVVCFSGPICFADDSANPISALEKKLHGQWQGQGPCDGKLILLANGSYERKRHGPAGDDSRGTWKLHWDALPPTLALSEAAAADGAETKWSVQKLSDEDLIIQLVRKPPLGNAYPSAFRRGTKSP